MIWETKTHTGFGKDCFRGLVLPTSKPGLFQCLSLFSNTLCHLTLSSLSLSISNNYPQCCQFIRLKSKKRMFINYKDIMYCLGIIMFCFFFNNSNLAFRQKLICLWCISLYCSKSSDVHGHVNYLLLSYCCLP